MWAIAKHYHFQPSEIEEMSIKDLLFWNDGISWYNAQMDKAEMRRNA